MSEIWQWSAERLRSAIRTGAVSSREATEAILARLDAVNPKINAVVEVLREEALSAADGADASLRRGEVLGPLYGVPVTIKINVDQKGCATTNGVVAFKDLIAPEDSPPVANWRKAGAILIGRTNVPAFSCRWFTDNALHGATRNPAAPGRTPGGSSGGAAAALAVGIAPLALGNDNAGSIRYPAYACGVTGLRPTQGRVPHYNGTEDDRSLSRNFMNVNGPMARHVADLRVGLATMAAADPRDPWWVPAPLEGPPPARPIKVAVTTGRAGIDPSVAEAVHKAGRWLADAGYAVDEVATPSLVDAARLRGAIAWNEARESRLSAGRQYGDEGAIRSLEGMAASAPELDRAGFVKALGERTVLLRQWQLFFETYPLVVMPVAYEPPFPDLLDLEGPEAMQRILAAMEPTLAVSLLGLPSLAVPTGPADGLPMGVQIVASRYREDLCLAAGEVVEARTGISLPIDPR